MDLMQRAKELRKLGFFKSVPIDQFSDLVIRAQQGDIDTNRAPATALFAASGEVLEIPFESIEKPEDYFNLVEDVNVFAGDLFVISDVSIDSEAEFISVSEEDDGEENQGAEPGENEEISATYFKLSMTIDGKKRELDLAWAGTSVDLSFIDLLDEHLQEAGSNFRFCPLVELMDDTARYVLAEPKQVEDAEIKELITAPDFEDMEDDD